MSSAPTDQTLITKANLEVARKKRVAELQRATRIAHARQMDDLRKAAGPVRPAYIRYARDIENSASHVERQRRNRLQNLADEIAQICGDTPDLQERRRASLHASYRPARSAA